ncbi:HEAT repeat domain-containing protein [Sediminibacterium sp.]|uniref:HEAT repeat domain-containing protein n=1 Tax=Sediminibacterium sp. TaxID=1917865 RepID=UPI0025F97C0F|nr:HEAT repeat domain-containing protein [Sediminibacterium sp.]MBW0176842.1 HEAT repeat domain-containing protein [Sediminibacterium sp.]
MNCVFDKEQLWSLALNELSEAEKTAVNLHVTSCDTCKAELNEIMAFCSITAALPEPEAPAGMKQRFMTELENYKQQQLSHTNGWSVWRDRLNAFITSITTPKFGYGLAMLVAGVLVTTVFFKTKDNGASEVQQLSSQVKEMREMLALSLLEHPSASERLRAVSYVEEIDTVDARVKDALLTTLNNDENVNVRLTALETLSKMTVDPKVREGLVQSIAHQDSPLIQSVLADLMLKMQEKKSVRSFQQLLKKPETNEAIKTKIKETIHQLS